MDASNTTPCLLSPTGNIPSIVDGPIPIIGLNNGLIKIIPAHAGQTVGVFASPRRIVDHPRACGANVRVLHARGHKCGSSPRMRGKLAAGLLEWLRRRIIPAHAGQTKSGWGMWIKGTDHPRACGANRSVSHFHASPSGSSPRMRGKPDRDRKGRVAGRIIPAHAGQTLCSLPRVGEFGSSPRMRGKPWCLACGACGRRIIPAHAGQTVEVAGAQVEQGGSSPRMRGKRAWCDV